MCLAQRQYIPSIREAVFYHAESLGTKLYSVEEAQDMFYGFTSIKIRTVVCAGDVLDFDLSERYKKVRLIRTLKRVSYPLKYVRSFLPSSLGGSMLIEAIK